MKKKIFPMVAVVVFAAALVILLSASRQPSVPFTPIQTPATPEKPDVNQTIEQLYPNSTYTIQEIQNCTSGQACWVATVRNSTMGGAGGASVGVGGDGRTVVFVEPIIYCNRSYIDNASGSDVNYTNTGCDNPRPTCGENNQCRACSAAQECISTVSGTFETGVAGQVLLLRSYALTGTNFTATFEEMNQICKMYENRMDIYASFINQTECEAEIYSHVKCESGICSPALT